MGGAAYTYRVSTVPNNLNSAPTTELNCRLWRHQPILQRIIGPCTYVLRASHLHGYSREQGATGLYVMDGRNGNLFFEPMESNEDLIEAGRLMALKQRLFERQGMLACRRENSWTLEDGYFHIGAAVETLVVGLAPTVEIFDLTRMRVAVPLSRVQGAAKFVAHPELPYIALSQRLHTTECEPRQWDMHAEASWKVG